MGNRRMGRPTKQDLGYVKSGFGYRGASRGGGQGRRGMQNANPHWKQAGGRDAFLGNRNLNKFAANKPNERMRQKREPTEKPINATEPKAYLYAYFSKRHSKPEYELVSHLLPNHTIMYISELTAAGFTYVGKGCATKKKDAQTRACWDFFDYLIETGKLTAEGLPKREEMYAAEKNKLPKTYKPLKYDPEQSPNDRKIEYFDDEAIEAPPTKKQKKAAEKAAQGELAEGGTKKRKKAKKSSDNEVAVEASNGATEEADNEPTTDVADEKKTVQTAEGEASDTKQPAVKQLAVDAKPAVNKKTKPSKP